MNKCDRTGANPYKVKEQLHDKLGLNSVLMQIPIGLEDKLEGVVDLVKMKAIYFRGDNGLDVVEEDIPANLKDEAEEKRELMLDAASMFSDELAEAYLNGEEIPQDMIHDAVRKGVLARELVPVFMGSAYKNKGIQPLLDAVVRYLPAPEDVENTALDLDDNEKEIILKSDPRMPTVALAFKLEDGQYGQLTYIRIYQGVIKKGDELYNTRSKKKFKVGRLIRMHASTMEDISEGGCGDVHGEKPVRADAPAHVRGARPAGQGVQGGEEARKMT